MSDRRYADFTAEERAELFHETFGNDLDGARTFEHILLAAGNYLGKLFNEDEANIAMTALVNAKFDAGLQDATAWRDFLSDKWSEFFSETDEGAAMHDLLAYAEFGIVLHNSSDKAELAGHIASLIEQIDAFWQITPIKLWQLEELDEIGPLLTWAKGRWALDNGEPIEPAALARLGNVSERAIRNMMSKKTLHSDNGKVSAVDALEWLSPRPDYWDSVWQHQALGERYPPQAIGEDGEAYVFVPVARDGSIFHPGLRSNHGYRVGPKGDERDFPSFDEALAALQSLPKPYWRRQNANGAWVLISGVRWERLSESDLAKFADDLERRLQSDL